MLITDTKLLLQFKNTSLYEDVNQSFFQAYGNTYVEVLLDGGGYVMKQDQYIGKEDVPLGINQKFIIGFWLYPVNPGLVENPQTQELESLKLTLIDLAQTNSSNYAVSLYESTLEDEKNYLTIGLNNGNYVASTGSYDIGMWHYFWIVLDTNSSLLNIYIDGTLQTLTGISGSLAPINETTLDVYINRKLDGYYNYNESNNYGYIDDIVILNTNTDYLEKLQQSVNHSILYAIDDNYMGTTERNYGLMFNDPSTITVNSMIDDMNYIYIARNDGKIMRGSPLLWETRNIFSDSKEINLLNETINSNNNSDRSSLVNGFLRIKNSTIRF